MRRIRKIKIILLMIPLLFVLLTVAWVLVLKWMPVVRTPLMDIRAKEFRSDKKYSQQYNWLELKDVSDNLAMAVMASEDTRYLSHNGFDMVEISNAINESKAGKRKRGASTISQQVAKNVFLTPSRSYIRKVFEAYFTILIEWIWGKERIMEVYLNVAEFGKGIYGAEAAAKHYFNCHASALTVTQSSNLAAILPSPLKRNPANPSPYVQRRSAQIRSLMNKIPRPEWL